MNSVPRLFSVLCVFLVFINSAAALCGRRGSPAFRAAENIIDNSTARDWSVLRCFLGRTICKKDEPAPFVNCILNGVDIQNMLTVLTVDAILMEIKAKSPKLGSGLVGLNHCLNQRMSCPEVRNILVCRQALDSVYSLRSTNTPKTTAIT